MFNFSVEKTYGLMRVGRIETVHGSIETPVFMPVGTQGTVKALSPERLKQIGTQIVLGNTSHLYLRPGMETLTRFGGLHQFMRWDSPILTDSGGYQVSSLGQFKAEAEKRLATIVEEGVQFVSHIDGSKHFITPELAIEYQQIIGADIIMAFDEATPDLGKTYTIEAMARTHRWLDRSKSQWLKNKNNQALFGIIQGGNYRELRRQSAEYILARDLPGIAIGGATMGQSIEETAENAGFVMDLIRQTDKPVYFMGVGVSPSHLIGAIKAGADMFDCVAPTKYARCGLLYSGRLVGDKDKPELMRFESIYPKEYLTIEKQEFKNDNRPIDPDCDCPTCRYGYTRGYLHHLFKCRELLYFELATSHNLRMMIRLTEEVRELLG
jgi:queuine tRNA-ribosyltransferase